MSATINLYEAKTQLSKYVEQAAQGETIIIAKAGKPVAKLVPLDYLPTPKIRYGTLDEKVVLPIDFDQESIEINALFEGHVP